MRALAAIGFVSVCMTIADLLFGASVALRDMPPGECWGVVTTYAYGLFK